MHIRNAGITVPGVVLSPLNFYQASSSGDASEQRARFGNVVQCFDFINEGNLSLLHLTLTNFNDSFPGCKGM